MDQHNNEEISQKELSESRRQLFKSQFRYTYQYDKNYHQKPDKNSSRK